MNTKVYIPDNCQIALLILDKKWISIPLAYQNDVSIEVHNFNGKVLHSRFIDKDSVAVIDDSQTLTLLELSSETEFIKNNYFDELDEEQQ